MNNRTATFLRGEYAAFMAAADAGDSNAAWHHLERAHIVSQSWLGPHINSHWKMLRYAMRLGDGREVRGQILRLALAPLGALTNQLPTGNTGRATISAFATLPVPEDLKPYLLG